jgi:hypothetical protein
MRGRRGAALLCFRSNSHRVNYRVLRLETFRPKLSKGPKSITPIWFPCVSARFAFPLRPIFNYSLACMRRQDRVLEWSLRSWIYSVWQKRDFWYLVRHRGGAHSSSPTKAWMKRNLEATPWCEILTARQRFIRPLSSKMTKVIWHYFSSKSIRNEMKCIVNANSKCWQDMHWTKLQNVYNPQRNVLLQILCNLLFRLKNIFTVARDPPHTDNFHLWTHVQVQGIE